MKNAPSSPRPAPQVRKLIKSPILWVSAAGLTAALALFFRWIVENPGYSQASRLAAAVSICLFTAVCLRFVPEWMRFWRFAPGRPAFSPKKNELSSETPKNINLKIFLTLFLVNLSMIPAVYFLRMFIGYRQTFGEYLEFWRCLDSGSYLNIIKDWYPTEGPTVVQLVFLPGYPVVVRMVNWLIGNELISGLLVSAVCFPAAGCVLYHLLRLDYPHKDALRTLRYLCLLPGLFFYTAPMSESLFLLLTVSCLYCCRTRQWLFGCLLGGYAAFTRSLGVTLLVPLLMELVRSMRIHPAGRPVPLRKWVPKALSLLLVPAGLGAYLLINYLISGDPFKFQQYQHDHWGQRLGLFFNTAAYQTRQAIKTYYENQNTFLGLWLPNLIASFSALVLVLTAVRRMRASYVAWFIAYFFIAIGTTWLLSAPRYLMLILAVPLALSLLAKKRAADVILTLLCAALNLLYLYAFVRRWQVW